MRKSLLGRLLVVVATAVMSVAVAPFMSSAAHAAVIDDSSTWTGTGTMNCGLTCTVNATSTTCQEVTTYGPLQIIRTGCLATLSGTFPVTDETTCSGVATGNYFHFTSAAGVPSQPWTTVLTFGGGNIHYEAFAVNVTGDVVGHASGDLLGGCQADSTFVGTESLG